MASTPPIYDLQLTLHDVEPVVSRTVRMSAGATLARAQRVFCVCFGWPGGRPYGFEASGVHYQSRGRDDELTDVRLRQLLPDLGAELEFEYGKSPWGLQVRVVGMHARNGVPQSPVCLAGQGVAPPIDAGGALAWNERSTFDHGEGSEGHAHVLATMVPLALINAELERLP